MMIKLARHKDPDVTAHACWALSRITLGANDKGVQAVLKANLTRHLVGLVTHSSLLVQHAAVALCAVILGGHEQQTQEMLDWGILGRLSSLLASQDPDIRVHACLAASNIAAGTPKQLEALMVETDLLRAVIANMSEPGTGLQGEAVWVINNITCAGCDAHVRYPRTLFYL